MNGTRGTRSRSVSLAFANFPKQVSHRRSHSSLSHLTTCSVRVVILGLGGVGKTAMTVRFMTKRFIGDYDPNLETIYRHTTTIDDQLVHFEIMDTAGQNENSVQLEDKCKWGESFIFVYDITDRHSFDELSRLKFIASYTHAKMRVNFKPCWILVGNKADLAENDRMVTPEEGMKLAHDLGCHLFHEISVKESINNSVEVFENLWREFSQISPRSPSVSQRRKFSGKLQDKISILDSESSMSASEALKSSGSGSSTSIVSSLASALKRQSSTPSLQNSMLRLIKDGTYNDANNNEERFDFTKHISRIPEDQKIEENPMRFASTPATYRKLAVRKNFESKLSSFENPDHLCKSISIDDVCATSTFNVSVPFGAPLTSSSRSSSNSSFTDSTSPSEGKTMLKISEKFRNRSDQENRSSRNSDSPSSDELILIYRDHCRRRRSRRCDVSQTPPGLENLSQSLSYQVGGY